MYIVGQTKLCEYIDHLIEHGQFPRFFIMSGGRGCGKKLICAYISQKLGALQVPCELSVDSVRSVIDTSYQQTEPTLYMWADAQNMSVAAKNAILKVTEEPPQNAYFALTTDNVEGLLGTLLSRGTVFNMQPYSITELQEFTYRKVPDISEKDLQIILSVATTPEDILNSITMDLSKFYHIVTTLCDYIGTTNLANELKISTFLKFKEDDLDKYDPVLFMRACMERFNKLFYENGNPMYYKLVLLTSQYLSDMNNKSLSKLCTVDNWILDLHESAIISEGG